MDSHEYDWWELICYYNQARFMVQGYTEIYWVNFDEIFAPFARLEAMEVLLGLSCLHRFKLHQMDVKVSSSMGTWMRKSILRRKWDYLIHAFPIMSRNSKKALYGLKQAPRASYERLIKFLTMNGYVLVGIENTLFVNNYNGNITIA